MTVPVQLQRIIAGHLASLGEPSTKSDVAAFLGITHSQAWYRYLSGHRSPSESTINGWLGVCSEAGIAVPASVGEALAVARE